MNGYSDTLASQCGVLGMLPPPLRARCCGSSEKDPLLSDLDLLDDAIFFNLGHLQAADGLSLGCVKWMQCIKIHIQLNGH